MPCDKNNTQKEAGVGPNFKKIFALILDRSSADNLTGQQKQLKS